MSEDQDKVDTKSDTKKIDLDGICAAGIVDPLINKPLWNTHLYAKMDNWQELYCPTHQIIYDRIKKMKELNALDGQE